MDNINPSIELTFASLPLNDIPTSDTLLLYTLLSCPPSSDTPSSDVQNSNDESGETEFVGRYVRTTTDDRSVPVCYCGTIESNRPIHDAFVRFSRIHHKIICNRDFICTIELFLKLLCELVFWLELAPYPLEQKNFDDWILRNYPKYRHHNFTGASGSFQWCGVMNSEWQNGPSLITGDILEQLVFETTCGLGALKQVIGEWVHLFSRRQVMHEVSSAESDFYERYFKCIERLMTRISSKPTGKTE